jgi:hypothetical protein
MGIQRLQPVATTQSTTSQSSEPGASMLPSRKKAIERIQEELPLWLPAGADCT